MTKHILFWCAVFTAICIGLGWSLRPDGGVAKELATLLPILSVGMLISAIWLLRSEKHKNSARGFFVAVCGPALMSILILGAAKFAPNYFDLSMIIGFHLFFIVTGNYVTTSTTWISGVPTFWNIKSRALWSKSQRFFGHGLVFIGLISLTVSLVQGRFYEPVFLSTLIALLVLGNIHSWRLWRQSRVIG